MFILLLFCCCLFKLAITHLSPSLIITTNKQTLIIFTWHAFRVLQYLAVAYKCNVMCFTAASNILSCGRGFILLTVAIETDNPQSEDVNSTELNVTCCYLGITVITTWRECSITQTFKLFDFVRSLVVNCATVLKFVCNCFTSGHCV